MRNYRILKTIDSNLLIGLIVLFFLLFLVLLGFILHRDKDEKLDYKLGILANDGVALVSISKDRKMINVLNLDKETEVWIPGGMSWYKNTKVKNILEQEKKMTLAKDVFWYNFGFFVDKVLVLNSVNDWRNDFVLIKNLGPFNWIWYKFNYGKMLLKTERINGKLNENETVLDEVMVRDFSESKLNNEELRLSVFNSTSQNGMAAFISKRLEWSGFSVISADNNNEKIEKCLVIYGNKTDLSYGFRMINKLFDCDKKYNENLNENELELYFGDSLASMIKYSSYTK